MALIPQTWFSQYSELFESIEIDDNETPKLRKYQIGLIQSLADEGLANTVINRKLMALREFKEIEEIPLPEDFKGILRPYQKQVMIGYIS